MVHVREARDPWLVWCIGWSIILHTEGLQVRFQVRAYTWVGDSVGFWKDERWVFVFQRRIFLINPNDLQPIHSQMNRKLFNNKWSPLKILSYFAYKYFILYFVNVMYFTDLQMLNNLCISKINLKWHVYNPFNVLPNLVANILLIIFASVFIKDIGLWFSLFFL